MHVRFGREAAIPVADAAAVARADDVWQEAVAAIVVLRDGHANLGVTSVYLQGIDNGFEFSRSSTYAVL